MWTTWLDAPLVVQPGQVLLVHPTECHLVPELCLPLEIRPEGLLVETSNDRSISPGDHIQLSGPIGKPFTPPETCRKWLLLAPAQHAGRLFPLVQTGLARGASVALWSKLPAPKLPPAVELLAHPTEALAWADYIALDLADEDPFDLSLSGLEDLANLRGTKIEVLRTPPMPCGFGGCGLCAIKGRRGWQLACVDGPVFDWNDLEF
jgi:hypothetical protein